MKTLTVSINNGTDKRQKVALFSLDNDIPKGVEVSVGESSYDFVLKTILSDPIYSTSMRIMTTDSSNFCKNISISNKNRNGQRSSFPMLPMVNYSPFQSQNHIVELTDYYLKVNVGFEVIVDVEPNSVVSLLLFEKTFNSDDDFRLEVKRNSNTSLINNYYSFFMENVTDEIQQVNLFDLNGGGIDNDKVNMIDSNFLGSYRAFLDYADKYPDNVKDYLAKCNTLKIYSENYEQLSTPLFSNDWDKENGLHPISYFSPYQEQRDVVECSNFQYNFSADNPIKFSLLPKTKILFMMYKTDESNKESKIREFTSKHYQELQEMGVCLVKQNEVTVIG